MDLLLAVLPFGNLDQPSLAASLLAAGVRREGMEVSVRYFTFPFAEGVGTTFYRTSLQRFGAAMIPGDWVFAEALFRERTPPPEEYLRTVLASQRPFCDAGMERRGLKGRSVREYLRETIWPRFVEARREAPSLAALAAAEILAERPRVVGFSVSNQQLCASLAVARLLKEAPEAPSIVFGGAACFGVMGLQMLRSFPWIDYVCTGEGDAVFPPFLRVLLEGRPTILPQGILGRGARRLTLPPPTTHLDELPVPDFSDWFRQAAASPLAAEIAQHLALPLETSRGCWWGESNPCTFCGSPEHARAFRSKSPERAAEEIAQQVAAHRPPSLCFVDDILDRRYFDTLFPLLAKQKEALPFFSDSKVNLTRPQIQVLYEAGARTVQFGIESLSNRLLGLLSKGNTVQQSLQTLRWSQEAGIMPVWNFLYGIPGERGADYDEMEELLPLLAHLAPPSACFPLMIMRFSRYHADASSFGLRNLRPGGAYRCIFPLSAQEIEGLAYYFECDDLPLAAPAHVDPVRRGLLEWMERWSSPPEERPRLEVFRAGAGELLVVDTRPCAVQPAHRLQGTAAAVYARCDRGVTLDELVREPELRDRREETAEALAQLAAARLVWREGERCLALALFRNRSGNGKGRRVQWT